MQFQKQKINRAGPYSLWLWAILFIGLIGFPLLYTKVTNSVITYESNKRKEEKKAKFANEAQIHIREIENKLHDYYVEIKGIERLFLSLNVERQEFKQFSHEMIAEFPGITRIEWIPKVIDSKRKLYESELSFTEKNENGEFSVAKKREQYFPIFFIEPSLQLTYLQGYDLGSEPSLMNALKAISEANRTVAIPIVPVIYNSFSETHIFSPIYNRSTLVKGQQSSLPSNTDVNHQSGIYSEQFSGFIRSVLNLHNIIPSIMEKSLTRKMDVIIEDLTYNNSEGQLLYHWGKISSNKKLDVGTIFRQKNLLTQAKLVDFFGRTLQISIVSNDPYYRVIDTSDFEEIWILTLYLSVATIIYILFIGLTHQYVLRKFRHSSIRNVI